MEGPGNRTSDPVPNEMTGYLCSEVASRICASILLLLLLAQTVQNFNLNGISSCEGAIVGVVVVPEVCGESTGPSSVEGGVETVVDVGGGGGGGGGAG